MTTYSAITSTERQVGAPLTASLAQKWTNNLLGVQENDATAPDVQYAVSAGAAGSVSGTSVITQTNMASNSIGTPQIKSAEAATSQSLVNNEILNFELTGGLWSLGYQTRVANSTPLSHDVQLGEGVAHNTYKSFLSIKNTSPTTEIFYANHQYITSSRPYDQGYGPIPIYLFLIIDNATKNIDGAWIAQDAPWHYGGPTNIRPDIYDEDGQGYKYVRPVVYERIMRRKTLNEIMQDSEAASYISRFESEGKILVPVDAAFKNFDMPIVPHPFLQRNLNGKTIVVLNPQSKIAETIGEMHDGGDDVLELVNANAFNIDNTLLDRGFDPSVQCVDVRWK